VLLSVQRICSPPVWRSMPTHHCTRGCPAGCGNGRSICACGRLPLFCDSTHHAGSTRLVTKLPTTTHAIYLAPANACPMHSPMIGAPKPCMQPVKAKIADATAAAITAVHGCAAGKRDRPLKILSSCNCDADMSNDSIITCVHTMTYCLRALLKRRRGCNYCCVSHARTSAKLSKRQAS
jgi:hypothetical protein